MYMKNVSRMLDIDHRLIAAYMTCEKKGLYVHTIYHYFLPSGLQHTLHVHTFITLCLRYRVNVAEHVFVCV